MRPEALVRDLAQVVLDQAQVEVGLQPLLLLDAAEEVERRRERPLGGVQVLELELREAAAGQRLDLVVRVHVLALEQLREDRRRRRPVPHLGVGGAQLEQRVLGVGRIRRQRLHLLERSRPPSPSPSSPGRRALRCRGWGAGTWCRPGTPSAAARSWRSRRRSASRPAPCPACSNSSATSKVSRWTPSGPLTAVILIGSISMCSTGGGPTATSFLALPAHADTDASASDTNPIRFSASSWAWAFSLLGTTCRPRGQVPRFLRRVYSVGRSRARCGGATPRNHPGGRHRPAGGRAGRRDRRPPPPGPADRGGRPARRLHVHGRPGAGHPPRDDLRLPGRAQLRRRHRVVGRRRDHQRSRGADRGPPGAAGRGHRRHRPDPEVPGRPAAGARPGRASTSARCWPSRATGRRGGPPLDFVGFDAPGRLRGRLRHGRRPAVPQPSLHGGARCETREP